MEIGLENFYNPFYLYLNKIYAAVKWTKPEAPNGTVYKGLIVVMRETPQFVKALCKEEAGAIADILYSPFPLICLTDCLTCIPKGTSGVARCLHVQYSVVYAFMLQDCLIRNASDFLVPIISSAHELCLQALPINPAYQLCPVWPDSRVIHAAHTSITAGM